MSNTSTLKSLGSGSRREAAKQKKPRADWLETFENPHPGSVYLVPFVQERDEFTSLCPKTGQPDHAKLEIIYVPSDMMIESKSLKEYLVTFRNHGEFHEDCINRITKDLYRLMRPKYIRVYGDFAPRGSLAIKPLVEKWLPSISEVDYREIRAMVRSWDTRK